MFLDVVFWCFSVHSKVSVPTVHFYVLTRLTVITVICAVWQMTKITTLHRPDSVKEILPTQKLSSGKEPCASWTLNVS